MQAQLQAEESLELYQREQILNQQINRGIELSWRQLGYELQKKLGSNQEAYNILFSLVRGTVTRRDYNLAIQLLEAATEQARVKTKYTHSK